MTAPGFVSLGGIQITRGWVTMPGYGIWHADLWLQDDKPVPPLTSLVLGDITGVCAVIRDADPPAMKERGVRVVGGFGGWRKPVPAEQYANPGITAGFVALDVASLVQETLAVDVDTPLVGPTFLRQKGAASLALNELFPDSWLIGYDGVTHTGPRVPGVVTHAFTFLGASQPEGIITIATDNPSEWLPGSTFANTQVSGTVDRVMHIIQPGGFRTEVCVV